MPEETVVTERVETAATETDAGNDAQDADALRPNSPRFARRSRRPTRRQRSGARH